MNQSKIESFIESLMNILSGFFIAMIVWQFIIIPLYGFDNSIKQNLVITSIFTVTSISRSYFWRRFFNKQIHKNVHKWIKKYFYTF